LIQVKKRQSEKKYVASVVAVGHECDLAILSVEDATFWEGLEPLKFGNIPELLEDVSVIGFPVGGDSLSITSGVVSRIEMQEYAQASAELLAIQIDAAINPGNSGGPVVNMEDEVIGVAFQSLSEEDIENIGYVVPVNVINHFLDDVKKNGRYSGVCGMGIKLQNMENEDLRKYYNMSAEQTGILVSGTAKLAPVSSLVFKGDVILSLDGIRVANDGTIPFRQTKSGFKERVQINYYFTQLFPSDQVKVEILRQGQRMVVDVPVWVPQALIPRILLSKNIVDTEKSKGTGSNGSIVGGTPSYLIVGGLVFVPLSKEYLASEYNTEHMGDFESWAEDYRILSLADQMKREEEEEVVLLSQVIAHTCNIGYETHRNMQLVSLNGNAIKNLKGLKHLVDSFLETTTRPLLFEFANGQIIVIDSNAGKVAQTQICQEHFIPHPCSDDLLL
jgi:S1-C subfamily serine protease